MGDGVSIDLGSAIPYFVYSFLGLFGSDAASRDWKARLDHWMKLSCSQAASVQCVGMSEPIPIQQIYQRTTICIPHRGLSIDINTMLEHCRDSIIFAGPGWGKTTLLHWTFIQLFGNKQFLPLLITLRWHDAVEYLDQFVDELQRNKSRKPSGRKVVLLVDGYDEISEGQRRKVSQSLALFSSLGVGNFYLTCRSHYDVFDLKCRHLELGPFTKDDARQFIDAYSRAYGTAVDGAVLVDELESHHLDEFAKHPLMLTLVCILKSGPSMEVPRRTIGLLRRAIDTLAFRWDEAKGIHRQSAIPLDGEERIRILMRIAFDMNQPQEPWETIQASAASHLQLLQIKNVNVRDLLHEMARFYGILVPVGDGFWQFAHRTVHDYLSARYWVESGKFDPSAVHQWDIHAAYAASLTADATDAMIYMLRKRSNNVAFTECLYNMAPFNAELVSDAVINRAGGVEFGSSATAVINPAKRIENLEVRTIDDFYRICSDEFLRILIGTAAQRASFSAPEVKLGCEVVAAIAMGELLHRGARIRQRQVNQFWEIVGSPRPNRIECYLPDEYRLSFSSSQVVAASGGLRPSR